MAVYRPSTAYWLVRDQFAVQHGQIRDVPVPGDYNGDGRADVAVYRGPPACGTCAISSPQYSGAPATARSRAITTATATRTLPSSSCPPASGDQESVDSSDSDRPATCRSLRDVLTVNRAIADFNGDGVTDVAVYWRATGHWLVNRNFAVQFGDGDDQPVPADYDRNGVVDIAVYRPSTGMWYVRDQFGVQFGDPGDVPIPGDYDGDGRADIAVYRPSTGTWFVRNRFAVQFGDPGDIPVPGDYNGDGVTDVAVYRPSTGSGTSATSWRCSSATRGSADSR